MPFSEKLRAARRQANLTQKELAERANVSWRAIQTWEAGRMPRSLDGVIRVAAVLGTTAQEMLDDADKYVISAAERGGPQAARDVDKLVSEVVGLFAGGEIDEEEKDGIMAALNEAYWIAKRANAKYIPKKYRE